MAAVPWISETGNLQVLLGAPGKGNHPCLYLYEELWKAGWLFPAGKLVPLPKADGVLLEVDEY